MKIKQNNIIFYIFTFCIVVSFIVIGVVISQHEKIWFSEYQQFETARNLIENNKPNEALVNLIPLIKNERYKKSVTVIWTLGLAQAGIGDYENALKNLSEVRIIKPFVLKDPFYLMQYGEALYLSKDYNNAYNYFMAAKELNNDEKYSQFIDQILTEIALQK